MNQSWSSEIASPELSKEVPTRMLASMLADGRLEEVEPRKAPVLVAQSFLKLYDRRIGLDVYTNHLPAEDLIV